jgi:sugar lactone lactonase YvrE
MNGITEVRQTSFRLRILRVTIAAFGAVLPVTPLTDGRLEVTVPDARAFPESIAATPDGTIFASSRAEGGIFRAALGAVEAERWIAPGANGSMSTMGVVADANSRTLWVCSSNLSSLGVPPPSGAKPVALKAFDLRTGKRKASFPLPGKASCNDLAVSKGDDIVYVTDSFQAHVLSLRPFVPHLTTVDPGATFDIFAEDPRFSATLHGIALGSDGNLYVNTFADGGLFRIDIRKDGYAGKVTQLETSRPLQNPAALRRYGTDRFLMVEGAGSVDIVYIQGDKAMIETVKDGFNGLISVIQIGEVAWVLEGQLSLLFDPGSRKVAPFHAYAVPLPR